MSVASRSPERIWVYDRKTLQPLDSFGRPGVAPGEFYGPAGERHVRVAVTATDERIAAAVERLAA